MKIVLVGAGNVATHLGSALIKNGCEIVQIYSRTKKTAKKLGELLSIEYCYKLIDVNKNADVYIYSLSDSALETIISQLHIPNAIHVHTAGSISIKIFEKYAKNYGIIYPLQTFSKNKKINVDEIPFFIEANSQKTEIKIRNIVEKISSKCYYLNSEKRIMLHLAAVFACNFSNYMYVLAAEIANNAEIEFNTLLPLIKETTNKLDYLSPKEAQTGPAVRNDEITLQKHIKILESNTRLKQIYTILSESIECTYKS